MKKRSAALAAVSLVLAAVFLAAQERSGDRGETAEARRLKGR